MNTARLIYQRDLIRTVLDRWSEQYPSDKHWFPGRSTSEKIRRNLAALDLETCSVVDVAQAMPGWSGWVDNECDECGADCPVLVRLGEEPAYDCRWQDLCEDCLRKAADMLAKTGA